MHWTRCGDQRIEPSINGTTLALRWQQSGLPNGLKFSFEENCFRRKHAREQNCLAGAIRRAYLWLVVGALFGIWADFESSVYRLSQSFAKRAVLCGNADFCLGPLAATFFSSRARARHSGFDVPGRNGRDVLETVEFFAAGHSPKVLIAQELGASRYNGRIRSGTECSTLVVTDSGICAEEKNFEPPRPFEPNGFADRCTRIGMNWDKGCYVTWSENQTCQRKP